MCVVLELNQTRIRPSLLVAVWGRAGAVRLVWAGFARRKRGWWKKLGAELVDVPAHRFTERSDRDRQLRWDDIPPGHVIRGLIDPHDGRPLLKIVTRASTPEEFARFEHPHMPLLELPLTSAAVILPLEDLGAPASAQGELF